MQGFFILADIDDPVLIGVRFGKAGLDGILQSVLCRLVDDVEGRQRLHSRHRSACGAGGGKAERKGGLALAGVALQNGQLSEGDIRIPQPVHLPQLHLRHSEDLGFVVYHNVFPFFSVVFFFARHSHIHPAFHKNLFCGARLCPTRESSQSFPALRSFFLHVRQRSYAPSDRVSHRRLCFACRVLLRERMVCAFLLRHDPSDRCPRKVRRRISCRQGIRLCLRGYPLILLWETILRLS